MEFFVRDRLKYEVLNMKSGLSVGEGLPHGEEYRLFALEEPESTCPL